MKRLRGLVAMGMLVTGLVGSLRAQEGDIRGRAVDADTGQPLQGALITLLDADGRVVLQRFSSPLGRFTFPDVDEGLHSVKADLLGYAEYTSEPFEVVGDTVVALDVPMTVDAILLEGLDVESERRCGLDVEEGLTLARVWAQVREALGRASLTGSVPYAYEVESFERHWDRRFRERITEEIEPGLIMSSVPYVSPEPKIFEEKGYVFRDPETNIIDYYGPDADVLLSDMFSRTHCFELERGEDESEGLIGVKFEPVDGRDVPEIRGVMWLEPETARLRWVEFTYENVARGGIANRLGGRMDFTELPNGTWIIDDWALRLPRTRQGVARRWGNGRRFTNAEIVGIREIGARVRRVRDPNGEPILDAEAGLVLGIVVDEDSEEPISGVLVEIVDTGRMARTNANGSFRFTGLQIGVYRFRFTAPNGDVLGEVIEAAEPGEQTFLRLIVAR